MVIMVGFYNKNHYPKGDFDGTGTQACAYLVSIRGAKAGQTLPMTRVDVSLADDLGISARDEIQERYTENALLVFSDKSKYVVNLGLSLTQKTHGQCLIRILAGCLICTRNTCKLKMHLLDKHWLDLRIALATSLVF
jgi:hypothetical protein